MRKRPNLHKREARSHLNIAQREGVEGSKDKNISKEEKLGVEGKRSSYRRHL